MIMAHGEMNIKKTGFFLTACKTYRFFNMELENLITFEVIFATLNIIPKCIKDETNKTKRVKN